MDEMIHREIVIPNDTHYLAEVRNAVMEVVKRAEFPKGDANKVIVAVDEAVTNIMQHAYEYDLEGKLEIEMILEADNTKFEVIIRDSGKTFDICSTEMPDIGQHVKNGKRHGLGIFLIRQIMDEVLYTFKNGIRNELRMVKYKDGKERGGEESKSREKGAL